jgi:hypothetical protein
LLRLLGLLRFLPKANGKPLAELITAEEAYVKEHAPADQEGDVEEAAAEVEESATFTLPSAWNKKGNK